MMRSCPRTRELIRATSVLLIATALAFAPDAYLPMLARAFMLPGALLFGVFALAAVVRRKWWVAQSALAGAAMLAGQLSTPSVPMVTMSRPPDLRVLHMNVWQSNNAYAAVTERALESGADVISVQEVAPCWAEALEQGLSEHYPYMHIEPRDNCYGMALFSRIPFREVRTITLHGTPMIEALCNVHERPVRLLAVHATSPISYAHFQRRNRQLLDLGHHLAQDDTATVLIGDLNTVPWDRAFQRLCISAALRSTTPPVQRTWPSIGPLALIPLDHVLISPGIVPVWLRTVHVPGSDHKGLLAALNLTDHAH